MTDSRDTRLAKARERAERRERIAAAVLGELFQWADSLRLQNSLEVVACDLADALIAELDRRRAAEEAQA